MPVATETIAKALRIVAAEGLQTDDGVIEACLRQAADRLDELEAINAPGPIASRIADSYAALIERAERAEAEVERLTKEVAAKDKALKVVQHAAKNLDSTGRVIAAHERKEAAKLLAMSNLEHLESERAANAILTEENERLKGELETEHLRLAAVGCAALGYSKSTDIRPEYVSASMMDVERLQHQLARRTKMLKQCNKWLRSYTNLIDKHLTCNSLHRAKLAIRAVNKELSR